MDNIDDILRDLGSDEPSDDDAGTDEPSVDDASPAVEFVELHLKEALLRRATHIHLVPRGDELAICYRIDGQLIEIQAAPKRLRRAITTRLKILASLDITERRQPQFGRFMLTGDAGSTDVRIATMPTADGEERIVLQLIDSSRPMVTLADSGLDAAAVETLRRLVQRRRGMILVCGPADSGRTTTLYNLALAARDDGADVITVEEDIARRLPGITQARLNASVGFTIDHAIKVAVAQDADAILTGFVGKADAAHAAFTAVANGRLVLADMFIRSAVDAVRRFLDCGIEPFIVADGLAAVLCQRLVRRLCEKCRERETLGAGVASRHGLAGCTVWKPHGCGSCAGGYAGRTAIGELIVIDATTREAISHGDLTSVKPAVPLRRAALQLVAQGVTSLAEALTVTDQA
jgi:type II secretory ATPase GspE/PulE/Tfp pilus assembly ATPase PilB-like protein